MPGSFAAREQAGYTAVLQCSAVARQLHGRRCAGFVADHQGIGGEKAAGFAAELSEAFLQAA